MEPSEALSGPSTPPAGFHHGGVWERCIRTVRKVMTILRKQPLDDESLNIFMCETESIVNGRPITKLSDDPGNCEPLTPNHLLLLHSGPSVPPIHLGKSGLLMAEMTSCCTRGGGSANQYFTSGCTMPLSGPAWLHA